VIAKAALGKHNESHQVLENNRAYHFSYLLIVIPKRIAYEFLEFMIDVAIGQSVITLATPRR
jgi:hypothetical protein